MGQLFVEPAVSRRRGRRRGCEMVPGASMKGPRRDAVAL